MDAKRKTVPEPDVGVMPRYCDHLRAALAETRFATKGDRTRHRLRIAAAVALEEGGYQKLKVADVCTLADVAMGTFYVYFRDKTDIATDVVLGFVEHLYDQAREVSRGTDEYRAIFNTNLFFVLAYRANPGLMRCHVQLQSQEPEFRALWEERHRRWLDVIGRSVLKRSSFPGLTPQKALKIAAALEGMVFNYLYSAAVTRESLIEHEDSDPAEMAETLSILWYRGVHGRDPEAGALSGATDARHGSDSGRS